jgi:hypothetical protein
VSNPITTSPPGWHADPAGTPQLRWFDGDQWTDEYYRLSDAERSDILGRAVAAELRQYRFCRIENRTSFDATLVYGRYPNHAVWALLSIFSCGFLLLGWIIAAATQVERRQTMAVDLCGRVIRA